MFSLAARVIFSFKILQWNPIASRLKPKELSMAHRVLQVLALAYHSSLVFHHCATNTQSYTQL